MQQRGTLSGTPSPYPFSLPFLPLHFSLGERKPSDSLGSSFGSRTRSAWAAAAGAGAGAEGAAAAAAAGEEDGAEGAAAAPCAELGFICSQS